MLVLLDLALRPSFPQLLHVNSLLALRSQDLTLPVQSSFGFADLTKFLLSLLLIFFDMK
jgi:hypothetical protein